MNNSSNNAAPNNAALDNAALAELSTRSNDLREHLVSVAEDFYRGQHSDAENKKLRFELIELLLSHEIFQVVKRFTNLPASVSERYSNIWGAYGEPRNAELFSIYGCMIVDCSITVTTESGERKKTNGACIDKFDIKKCPEGATNEYIANRLLTYLARLFGYALRTEQKKRLRYGQRLTELSGSDDSDDSDNDVSNDEDNIALASYDDDYQATVKTLDEYLGGFPRLVTAFLEKHKKIRTKVPLAPMFYTEELIRVLQELPPKQFKDEYSFYHEVEVFELVPRSWLDYLMLEEGIATYRGINATRLKYWSELFGAEPFGNISKEKWNLPIPLVQRWGDKWVLRLDKNIYADYLKKNNMENVSESKLSEYHSSFNSILDEYREHRKKYLNR